MEAEGERDRDLVGGLLEPRAGGWLGRGPMSVSDGHMGIESQRLPGQGMTGVGPDVVKRPR